MDNFNDLIDENTQMQHSYNPPLTLSSLPPPFPQSSLSLSLLPHPPPLLLLPFRLIFVTGTPDPSHKEGLSSVTTSGEKLLGNGRSKLLLGIGE